MDLQVPFANSHAPPLLETRALKKVYIRGRWARRSRIAFQGVDLALFRGSTLALVGKSGSGKSTLARCLALLERPDAGEIRLRGLSLAELSSSELRRLRPCVQLVWQHSALALNPRFRLIDSVAEPLRIQGLAATRRRERALAALYKVGIPESLANRTPLQLSGGQRQRVAIARALILEPAVIIFDEPLTGLDVPLQVNIAKMLIDLRASVSLSYIFISHDLRMAAYVADTMAVMAEGRIVELRSVQDLLLDPHHSATRELLASVPTAPIR